VKIDAPTRLWCVTDPTPQSTLPDICFATTLDGLRLQFAGGLSMDDHPAVFTSEEEAHEEAKNRLLVGRIARQIRIDRRVADDEVVRVTLQDRGGTVLFEGEVR
jgi:hypothetical protein